MKFGHFVPICIPETYQVTRFHCDIFIRLIRLKTEVEELVSQRTEEKAYEQIEESRLKRDISSF